MRGRERTRGRVQESCIISIVSCDTFCSRGMAGPSVAREAAKEAAAAEARTASASGNKWTDADVPPDHNTTRSAPLWPKFPDPDHPTGPPDPSARTKQGRRQPLSSTWWPEGSQPAVLGHATSLTRGCSSSPSAILRRSGRSRSCLSRLCCQRRSSSSRCPCRSRRAPCCSSSICATSSSTRAVDAAAGPALLRQAGS